MIRNLKVLGLALVAIFAFSAVAAAGASAQQGWLTSDGPVTLDIKENPETENWFEAFGSRVECPETLYTGHEYDVTPHEPISVPDTTATITPHFDKPCHVTGGRQATIAMNGCDFVFHLGETTPPLNTDHTYGVTADVDCPDTTTAIVVTVFGNTPPAAEGSDVCTLRITGQTGPHVNQGLKGVHVTDETNGHLHVKGTFENIHAHRSGACVLLGGGTTTNVAKFAIDATVSGTDEDGLPTDIEITEQI